MKGVGGGLRTWSWLDFSRTHPCCPGLAFGALERCLENRLRE
jgi:hypothetical protein